MLKPRNKRISPVVASTPLALNYLITTDTLPYGPLMAGAVLSSVLLILLFFLAQRFMVQGMTARSVKG